MDIYNLLVPNDLMYMFFFRLSSTNTSDQQSFGLAPSRLTTTGPGPSSMRKQDQYAVIHISCFPADYSENLLRRHFGIEFVTLTVYTNRSGMYITIPSSVRVVTFLYGGP